MESIRELYQNLIQGSDYMKDVDEAVEKEIVDILKEEREKLTLFEYEEYRAKIYQILASAEEEAFLVGFRYAIRLILEI